MRALSSVLLFRVRYGFINLRLLRIAEREFGRLSGSFGLGFGVGVIAALVITTSLSMIL